MADDANDFLTSCADTVAAFMYVMDTALSTKVKPSNQYRLLSQYDRVGKESKSLIAKSNQEND